MIKSLNMGLHWKIRGGGVWGVHKKKIGGGGRESPKKGVLDSLQI